MSCLRASSIPSGLIACRFGKNQLRIEEITPCSVDLFCDENLPDHCLMEFFFYQPASGVYRPLQVAMHKYGQTPGKNTGGSVRFIFDDKECASEIKKTLGLWSEYVNMKISGGPERFAEKYLGYPENTDVYFDTIGKQYAAWFSSLSAEPGELSRVEIALTLDLPSAWNAFIAHPMPEFLRKYAKIKRLPEDFFDNIPVQRLYIGCEHCFHLFPDGKSLEAIVRKAANENTSLSFCTSIVHQSQLNAAKLRLEAICALLPRAEIIVNDWGMLNLLQNYPLSPVLGTILNRFRRDPRIKWKAGMDKKAHLLSRNALNDPVYREFLSSFGIQRCEYAADPEMNLHEGAKSLHFPFSPTNTSAYCPLKAYIETGSRGKQAESVHCPVYCEENAFLYPEMLRMIHRTRSIFAVNTEFADAGYLNCFDRLVFNF